MARDGDAAGEAYMDELLGILREGKLRDKAALHSAKVRLARKFGLDRIPSDAEVLKSVPPESRKGLLPLLRTKAVREVSGVVTVAAMSSPERCPHGKCLYCPGGVERNSPQSYTGREPAAMRGSHYGYDSFREVGGRLEQLAICGHPVDKVDLIIMGGTFLSRPPDYQVAFVKGCYDAMNGRASEGLELAIDRNEDAPSRCIGLTIETRPDWCLEEHIDRMLSYGTTRVEMGVQSLSDAALARMQRGHGTAEVARATRLARDAGLKVGYHMMPGFPFVERSDELSQYRRLFEDPALRPDLLKLYPTLVMEGTGLHELWKSGEYVPMTAEEAADFLSEAKSHFPPWVRVQRIQRDIPAQLIAAGVRKGNLRQMVRRRMADRGLSCRCIRCREVGHLGIRRDGPEEPALRTEAYDAAGGREAFISLETSGGALAGYARLRRPSTEAHRPELGDGRSAIVRELRVLGELVPIDGEPDGRWQHRGLGARLMEEAERLAREDWKMARLLINSGAGARGYYRRTGYDRVGPYMGKTL